MPDETKRIQVTIGEECYFLIWLWAKTNGVTVSTYIRNLAQSRAQANRSEILGAVDLAAERQGLTRWELIDKWRGEDEGEE